MDVSTRTPEVQPHYCRICDKLGVVELAGSADAAVCPFCGGLLASLRDRLAGVSGFDPGEIDADTPLVEIFGDSLSLVEWVMALERDFDVRIPQDLADRFDTLGDLVRWLKEQRGGDAA